MLVNLMKRSEGVLKEIVNTSFLLSGDAGLKSWFEEKDQKSRKPQLRLLTSLKQAAQLCAWFSQQPLLATFSPYSCKG